ncbi:unnamed protein product, partial [Amoebophrya sp. A120]
QRRKTFVTGINTDNLDDEITDGSWLEAWHDLPVDCSGELRQMCQQDYDKDLAEEVDRMMIMTPQT